MGVKEIICGDKMDYRYVNTVMGIYYESIRKMLTRFCLHREEDVRRTLHTIFATSTFVLFIVFLLGENIGNTVRD